MVSIIIVSGDAILNFIRLLFRDGIRERYFCMLVIFLDIAWDITSDTVLVVDRLTQVSGLLLGCPYQC